MFQTIDKSAGDLTLQRSAWMALLARAPLALLEPALGHRAGDRPHWLRAPETGLMMVQARVGGTGERFNLGEVTVTRCALRLGEGSAQAAVGVAYVLGRSHRQARLAAMADALLQNPAHLAELDQCLLGPIRQHLDLERAQRLARAETTKVDFFTVARESGDNDDSGDDA